MNQFMTYPETPCRRSFSSQKLPIELRSSVEDMVMEKHDQSFMTPMASSIITQRSSPPPLCRERKRERPDNIFESEDGCVSPQFLIPELSCRPQTSPQRTPIKFRLTQRLTPPSIIEEETRSNAIVEDECRFVPIQLSKTFDESTSFSLRLPGSLHKSVNETSFKVPNVERPKKLKRRSSSTALSA